MKLASKLATAIKADSDIHAQAVKLFDNDEFEKSLNDSERVILLNFLLNKLELMRFWPED